MRKQYYFRPSKNGFYAWDVDRLVRLSQNLPIIEVALNEIREWDKPLNGGGKSLTYRWVAEHMKLVMETDLKYPIILSCEGNLMDGMHRVIKAFLLNHGTIRAVRFKEDLKPDYEDVKEDDLPYD